MNAREQKLNDMAEAISDYVDLDDVADVAVELIVKGFHGADIGDDIQAIIRRARAMRAGFNRNQIVDIAETVAEF